MSYWLIYETEGEGKYVGRRGRERGRGDDDRGKKDWEKEGEMNGKGKRGDGWKEEVVGNKGEKGEWKGMMKRCGKGKF